MRVYLARTWRDDEEYLFIGIFSTLVSAQIAANKALTKEVLAFYSLEIEEEERHKGIVFRWGTDQVDCSCFGWIAARVEEIEVRP